MNRLEKAREKINKIDKEMAELFESRMDCMSDVVGYKMDNDLPIFDSSREDLVIEKNMAFVKNDEYKEFYREFIVDTMNTAKRLQKRIAGADIVGFQGTLGSFSHIASGRIFPKYKRREYPQFEDVFKAIMSEEIPLAVLPFENSFTGEIGDILDLLAKYDCYIHSMYDLKIDQNLIGLPDAEIADITDVFSHEQALMQSSDFLNSHDLKQNLYANTALAAKFVCDTKNKAFAAVASKETADIYGLKILAKNIHTSKFNTTRFAVISKRKNTDGDCFNAIFRTKHHAGDLAKVLSVISECGFNVQSIKSRSIKDVPWEYYFYIEIVGSVTDSRSIDMMEKVMQNCEQFKVIGSYFKEN